MAKFLVYIQEDKGQNVVDKIDTLYPNGRKFKISDDWWGIKSDNLTDDVAKELGFILPDDSDESPAIGLVVREEVISGFYNKSFWEWYNNE